MPQTDFDTIVMGGGIIGLATAYYSAAAGKRTLLIEKNRFYHEHGSSGGNSRFFRIMYSEEPLAMLSENSYALWKQLETKTGSTLIDERPLLFFGDKQSGHTVEGDFNNADKVMLKLGVPFESLDFKSIQERYPVFKTLPENYSGLIQNNSGVIQVKNSMKAFYGLAKDAGAELRDETPAEIADISADGEIITIKTPTESFTTRSLAISAGGWSNKVIAPLDIQFALKIWQMTIGYYKVNDPSLDYPFWYEFGKQEKNAPGQNLFYGFPVGTDVDSCIKASCDFTFNYYDDISDCKPEPNPNSLKLISQHLQKRFHGVSPEPIETKTCMYTMSNDYHMILGLLPGYNNISILTGESGRACKYAPIFGRILSQLAHHGQTPYDIDCVSIDRAGILLPTIDHL